MGEGSFSGVDYHDNNTTSSWIRKVINSYLLLSLITTFLLSSCLKPQLEPLNFFKVITDEAKVEIEQLAGTINLHGRINFDSEGPMMVDEYGFFWSNDNNSLEDLSADVEQISFTGYSGDDLDFVFENFPIENGSTYFYQAYAKAGDRLMRGEIRSFSEEVSINVQILDRINDSILLRIEIQDLIPQRVENFGLLWGKDAPSPTIETAQNILSLGPQTQNIIVDTLLGSFEFNTTYYFRPYFQGADNTLGEVITYRVTDGWKKVGDLPNRLYQASAAFSQEEVWTFGGRSNSADQPVAAVYAFDFALETWKPRFTPSRYNLAEGVAVNWDGELFFGQGTTIDDRNPIWTKYPSGNSLGWALCSTEESLEFTAYNGVAFTEGNRLFYGLGFDPNTGPPTNNFWEISDLGNCYEERLISPMPARYGSMSYTWGRQGAIAFVLNNTFYVGGGKGPALELSDLWRFHTPDPSNPQDSGRWEYVCELPGPPRTEAVAFTIGDRAFFGTGVNPTIGYFNDLWEFSEEADACWIKRESCPGKPRKEAIAFGFANRGYLAGGYHPQPVAVNAAPEILFDTWVYIPTTN